MVEKKNPDSECIWQYTGERTDIRRPISKNETSYQGYYMKVNHKMASPDFRWYKGI